MTPAVFERPTLRSSDSADELLQLSSNELYARLALFLLDIDGADFPRFYQDYLAREDRTDDLTALILAAWCRVDSTTAIQTTQGTQSGNLAYWALSGHDPEAAFQLGLENKRALKTIAAAIGEFHPKWLTENWDRIPEDVRRDALIGLASRPNTDDPELSLTLLLRESNEAHPNPETLLALVREDLPKTLALLQELEDGVPNYYAGSNLNFLVDTLSQYEPRLLSRVDGRASEQPVR